MLEVELRRIGEGNTFIARAGLSRAAIALHNLCIKQLRIPIAETHLESWHNRRYFVKKISKFLIIYDSDLSPWLMGSMHCALGSISSRRPEPSC